MGKFSFCLSLPSPAQITLAASLLAVYQQIQGGAKSFVKVRVEG